MLAAGEILPSLQLIPRRRSSVDASTLPPSDTCADAAAAVTPRATAAPNAISRTSAAGRAVGAIEFERECFAILLGNGKQMVAHGIAARRDFLRDRFACQYCNTREELTFDHVIPRSKGGLTTWENVVAACSPCNLRKGDKMPATVEMFPAQKPYAPTVNDLHRNGKLFPPNYLHESWLDYLYWDSELEP